jgi:predicted nucleic acid-binding Zn ribbon protein
VCSDGPTGSSGSTRGDSGAPDLVALALERARADSVGRPLAAARAPRRTRTPSQTAARSTAANRIGELLGQWIGDSGADVDVALARVMACWDEVVGAEVAAHCNPRALDDGVLHIVAESTAWATQLRLLAPALTARVRAELLAHSQTAAELLREVRITGPVGPSWKKGRLSVQGRGPRDTYG